MRGTGVTLVAYHEDDTVPVAFEPRSRQGACPFRRIAYEYVTRLDALDHHEVPVAFVIDEHNSGNADHREKDERQAKSVGTKAVLFQIALQVQQREAVASNAFLVTQHKQHTKDRLL